MNLTLSTTTRWLRWEQWLQNQSMTPRKRLLEAINYGQIPEQLLHQFACDCALRAISFHPQRCHSLCQQLSDFINQKQKIAQSTKKISVQKETMHQLYQQAKQATKRMQSESERLMILTVSRALFPNPITAARYASKDVYIESEREWHCEHLAHLMKQLRTERQSICNILHQRCWNLSHELMFWQKKYEEQLF